MDQHPKTQVPVGLLLAAICVLAAAFLPWGEIRQGAGGFPGMFSGSMTFTVTGWNGHLSLAGMKVPNWLLVIVASGVAAVVWLSASGHWKASPLLPLIMAVYGALHSSLVLLVMVGASEATLGIGVLITLAAFLTMVVLLVKARFRLVHQP